MLPTHQNNEAPLNKLHLHKTSKPVIIAAFPTPPRYLAHLVLRLTLKRGLLQRRCQTFIQHTGAEPLPEQSEKLHCESAKAHARLFQHCGLRSPMFGQQWRVTTQTAPCPEHKSSTHTVNVNNTTICLPEETAPDTSPIPRGGNSLLSRRRLNSNER